MCSIREVVCPKRELGLGGEKRSPGERDDATTTTIGVFHYEGRVSGGREFRLGREKERRREHDTRPERRTPGTRGRILRVKAQGAFHSETEKRRAHVRAPCVGTTKMW